jgi:hypothetical protein
MPLRRFPTERDLRKFVVAGMLLAATLGPARPRASTTEEADRLAGPSPGGVTGKVMNAEGKPLEGVRVTLRHGELSSTAETDREGVYCFCRVSPARDYILVAERDGFARVMQGDLSVAARKLAVLNLILRPQEEFLPPGNKGMGP